MNTPIWNLSEYQDTLKALRAESSAGVLLTGELGMGKSVLVRDLLASGDLRMPVFRLICSSALTTSPYGALAPLLTYTGSVINDVIAIREALGAVDEELAGNPDQKQVLIVVEEAQYIDSASAFVLGQLVRSGSVKLLVLSTEEHQDPISMEALMSVARLTRIRLDSLSAQEVADSCSRYLGGRLSLGTARIIRQATEGIHVLVQSYLDLLVRQNALIWHQGFWVLKDTDHTCDEHAVAEMRELVHRQHPALRAAIELLSLSGPLSLGHLKKLSMLQTLQQYPTALIRVRNGKAYISSSYFAHCVRQSLPPGHNIALFDRFCALMGDQLPQQPEMAQWLLLLGRPIPPGLLQQVIPLAIMANEHSLALELLDYAEHLPESWRLEQRTRALLGAGLTRSAATLPLATATGEPEFRNALQGVVDRILSWSELEEIVSLPQERPSGPEECSTSSDQTVHTLPPAPWQDDAVIGAIDAGRQAYEAGQLSEVLSLARLPVIQDQLLAPSCIYRLSMLVLVVRGLVSSGQFENAKVAIDAFPFADNYELLHTHGTVQLLRAFVLVHEGKISQAAGYLEEAAAELRQRDPEGLRALCTALFSCLNSGHVDSRSDGPASVDGEGLLLPDESVHPRSGHTWWCHDRLQVKLLQYLRQGKDSATTVGELLETVHEEGIILQDALYYQVWRLSRDAQLHDRVVSFYSRLVIPGNCVMVQIHRQIVLLSDSGEIDQMEDYALTLHRTGQHVAALELYTRIVDYWSTRNDTRQRGFAIRKMHEWLHDLGQEPWGIVEQTLGTSGLTSREEEIVDLVRQGMSNREIAKTLTVSQRTVEGHLYRIFAKLGITQRTELNFGG